MLSEKHKARHEASLKTCQPEIVRVVDAAQKILDDEDSGIDLLAIEGLRSKQRQKKLFVAGATKTLKSRHLTGHAVDVVPVVDGEIRWDWPLFDVVVDAVRRAAKELQVEMVHGADWKRFRDGPHHELSWKAYPA